MKDFKRWSSKTKMSSATKIKEKVVNRGSSCYELIQSLQSWFQCYFCFETGLWYKARNCAHHPNNIRLRRGTYGNIMATIGGFSFISRQTDSSIPYLPKSISWTIAPESFALAEVPHSEINKTKYWIFLNLLSCFKHRLFGYVLVVINLLNWICDFGIELANRTSSLVHLNSDCFQ